ncbi:hypothetical protein LCGC14_1262260 [marine sediment metagenome]|uniref:Uncharacterized protein n=1 Tax=marine sediment metagenome TaxID=412755 RepID=A0A0F8XTN0_9ZZZZ
MNLVEKFERLIKKYPKPEDFMDKLVAGGALLGASGYYTPEELIEMNNDVWGLFGKMVIGKINVTNIAEAFLLLEGVTREFIEKVADFLLENIEKKNKGAMLKWL